MTAQHAAGWTRRTFLGGVTLAGTAGLLGLYPRLIAAEPPPETTRLRLGRLPGSLCGAPLVVAEEFLPGEGFTEVQYVDLRGSSYPQATAAGEIDFGSNFIGPTLTRLDAAHPLVLLSGTHVGCFELFAREQVRAVRELKGKTMAVRQLGNTEHTFISSILAYVGIDPQKEVHWVTHPFDASTQLFAEGKIDAVAAQPPQSQELRKLTMALNTHFIGVDFVLKVTRLDKSTMVGQIEFPILNPTTTRELTYRRIE
jgi:NitT/TauT family transport system substrate-binding protein